MLLQEAQLNEGSRKMGWKEVWEKYQIAATFAEAGEDKMARHFLEDGLMEKGSSEKEGRLSRTAGEDFLKTSPAEG
jgi:hypothetical protein